LGTFCVRGERVEGNCSQEEEFEKLFLLERGINNMERSGEEHAEPLGGEVKRQEPVKKRYVDEARHQQP